MGAGALILLKMGKFLIGTIAFLLLVLLAPGCKTSEPVVPADGMVEPALEAVAGINDEAYQKAAQKAFVNPEPDKPLKDQAELTLDDVYAIAVEKTERLAIGQEKVIQAEAQKNRAAASWIPTLSWQYSRFYTIPDHSEKDRKRREEQRLAAIALNNPALWPVDEGSTGSLPANLGPGSRLVLHVPIISGLNEYGNIKTGKTIVRVRKYELAHDAARMYLESPRYISG